MKRLALLTALGLLVGSSVACELGQQATSTPDTQATINAAVAATGAAQAANQATITAAVAATTAAQARPTVPPVTPVPTLVISPTTGQTAAAATPLPLAAYAAMTEEELAALVQQTVNAAAAATQQYSAAATQAAADNTLTTDDVQSVEIYFANADQAIAAAQQALSAYNTTYGQLAVETVDQLQGIENDLNSMVAAVNELNQTMTDINSSLEQGLELATGTITQVQTTAQSISASAQAAQAQAQTWQAEHQTSRDNRIATAVAMPATQTGGDPQAALKNVLEFVQVSQAAVTDNQFSAAELTQVAQLAANAGASLNASGNPQLQNLAGMVTSVTEHLAGGNMPQAQSGLEQLGVAAPLALPANQVTQDPRNAIQNALNFANTGRSLLSGDKPTPDQLVQLAQLGANASASLNASGMPQLQQLSATVNDITSQIALGRGNQAQLQLDQLGASLGSLPDISLPELPNKPSLPNKPGRSK